MLMTRRRAAWLISLPLVLFSWLGAHCLAYRLAAPGAEHHMGLHAESGHAYLGYTPAFAIWLAALALAGLLLCVAAGLRGGRPSRPPVRLFVLLPPVGFVVQEHAERLLGTGAVPPDLVTEPAFVLGLALELPFALAALLVAYALQTLAFGAGRSLARTLAIERLVPLSRPAPAPLPASATLVTPSVLALGHGQRAPPIACRP